MCGGDGADGDDRQRAEHRAQSAERRAQSADPSPLTERRSHTRAAHPSALSMKDHSREVGHGRGARGADGAGDDNDRRRRGARGGIFSFTRTLLPKLEGCPACTQP